MSSRPFVHLHVHTLYSLLDGANRIGPLVARAAELGMPALGMTDHGNMYGAVDFYKRCKSAGVKPIVGMELNVVHGDVAAYDGDKTFHLTVLARNVEGYRNLMRLTSMAHIEGYIMGTPYVDHAMIKRYADGVIALSGDLGGEIPQAILRNNMQDAQELAAAYRDLFEPGHFFLEVMANSFPEQARVNAGLIEIARALELPLVATNDCHYLDQEHARAHAILMCIQLGKTVELDQVMAHGIDDFYLKTPIEMWEAFADLPEACENTLAIADMVDFEMPLGSVFLPQYQVPEEFVAEHALATPQEAINLYFAETAREGLVRRMAHHQAQGLVFDPDEYRARLEIEIGVIQEMVFPGYFLIVWDFIRWAKEQGIAVGPGRGSGAGSLVAYCLDITDINPMQYGLLFERFLNPDRVSMPDFDIDFCMNRRGEVIQYVTQKYGEHNVGQIITYGSLKARACIRDVGRALSFSLAETDRIAKMVPETLGITLAQALEQEPKLRKLVEEDERVAKLYEIAEQLEGLYRQAGMHAAGVVISEQPLWEYVPVCRGVNGEFVTQYAKNEVEEAGLVKFDFLGLKTLTVLQEAVRLIDATRAGRGEGPFDLSSIPMDDSEVFRLISEGRTTGVFQLESSGFRELLVKLKPDCFEDIVAAVALYRPGPMGSGMLDDFVLRKHGEVEVVYPHPALEVTLRETYGVFVYQEQVMQSARVLAGYSLGGADIMRRAMGKKKPSEMAKQREIFVDGAAANGVDVKRGGEIFDLIESFAGYGFNKSHSAAYALISYQTAYLKAHYPVEFTAATLTCDRDNTAKIVRSIHDARISGVDVLPPDANESQLDFSVSQGKIRFGLGAIKGVGEGAIESVIEARREGPFTSLFDFCERVDLKRVNRRVVEALVKCGAFDSCWHTTLDSMRAIGAARAAMFEVTATALDRGQRKQAERAAGQTSLFDMFAGSDDDQDEHAAAFPSVEGWNDKQVLALEKETIGFYVTGHPLDRYIDELELYASADSVTIARMPQGSSVTVAGVVAALRERPLKSGDGRMGFAQLEDLVGQVEILCFAKCYGEYEEVIKSDEPLLVRGTVTFDGDGAAQQAKVRANEVLLLTAARAEKIGHVMVEVAAEKASTDQLGALAQLFDAHPGECRAYLRLQYPSVGFATLALPEQYQVAPSDDFINAVTDLFGERRVKLGLRNHDA